MRKINSKTLKLLWFSLVFYFTTALIAAETANKTPSALESSLWSTVIQIGAILYALWNIYKYALKPLWKIATNVRNTLTKVEEIGKELKPNGGGSLYDCVHRVEREIARQGGKMRLLFKYSDIVAFETDENGEVIWVSTKFVALTGVGLDRAKGRGWLIIIHPDDRERVSHEWQHSVEQKREFQCRFNLINSKNSSTIEVNGKSFPVTYEDGKIAGYIGNLIENENSEKRFELPKSGDTGYY